MIRNLRTCTALALLALLLACTPTNPHYDPAKKHHRPDGFTNNYFDDAEIGAGFWRWQWQRLIDGVPAQDAGRVPLKPVDLTYLKANRADTTVTFLGHATALWQLGGRNILTDPIFSDRASPVSFAGPKRVTPVPLKIEELPRIDVVFVSHNHYDHLDRPTVLALNRQPGGPPLFVVPLGIDLWLRSEGITNVKGLDWWDSHAIGDLVLTLVPNQHWSARTPFDRRETLWGGIVAAHAGYTMFYSGDTGYSRDFADIGARFGGFDYAQMPVGCYEPRWFMKGQHVNEDEAVRIHQDVKSRFSVGVHWGAYRLCDDPVEAPLDGLPKARANLGVPESEFVLLAIGETRVLRRQQ